MKYLLLIIISLSSLKAGFYRYNLESASKVELKSKQSKSYKRIAYLEFNLGYVARSKTQKLKVSLVYLKNKNYKIDLKNKEISSLNGKKRYPYLYISNIENISKVFYDKKLIKIIRWKTIHELNDKFTILHQNNKYIKE